MSSEPVVFSTVAEGARKAFGPQLTPELHAKLKVAGFDLQNIQAAYPVGPFIRAIGVLCDALVPGCPPEEQHRLLGREFIAGYRQTAIGLAIFTMSRAIGVKRSLLRMGRNLRTTGNYLGAEVSELAPKSVQVVTQVLPEFRGRITPHELSVMNGYRLGVFEGMLLQLGVDGDAALEGGRDQPDATFRVSWR
ncbi:MAG: hypothetical protein AMXMBFR34_16010 [Myxococcaceae bacterium]